MSTRTISGLIRKLEWLETVKEQLPKQVEAFSKDGLTYSYFYAIIQGINSLTSGSSPEIVLLCPEDEARKLLTKMMQNAYDNYQKLCATIEKELKKAQQVNDLDKNGMKQKTK
jgi:hypothetical protein